MFSLRSLLKSNPEMRKEVPKIAPYYYNTKYEKKMNVINVSKVDMQIKHMDCISELRLDDPLSASETLLNLETLVGRKANCLSDDSDDSVLSCSCQSDLDSSNSSQVHHGDHLERHSDEESGCYGNSSDRDEWQSCHSDTETVKNPQMTQVDEANIEINNNLNDDEKCESRCQDIISSDAENESGDSDEEKEPGDSDEERDSEDSEEEEESGESEEENESGDSDEERESLDDSPDEENETTNNINEKNGTADDSKNEENEEEEYETNDEDKQESESGGWVTDENKDDENACNWHEADSGEYFSPQLPPRYNIGSYPAKSSDLCQKSELQEGHFDMLYGNSNIYQYRDESESESEDEFCLYSTVRSAGEGYAFPCRQPRTIKEVMNFWKYDFQVGEYIFPCMSKWEQMGISPDKEEQANDHRQFSFFKSLHNKWLGCNQSSSRWYSNYAGRTLTEIANMKPKTLKRRADSRSVCESEKNIVKSENDSDQGSWTIGSFFDEDVDTAHHKDVIFESAMYHKDDIDVVMGINSPTYKDRDETTV